MRARRLAFAALALGASILSSCSHVDNERIPRVDVRITFSTVGEWNTYGVPAALDHRRFIRSEKIPADYPYTAMTYTGFGGVLLVCDVMGNPQAYDLACPVEVVYSTRVAINPETNLAECPVCHSTYDVFVNMGAPITGPAAQYGFGLTRYRVGPGPAGEYMVISR